MYYIFCVCIFTPKTNRARFLLVACVPKKLPFYTVCTKLLERLTIHLWWLCRLNIISVFRALCHCDFYGR
jgi:hypothetical protein